MTSSMTPLGTDGTDGTIELKFESATLEESQRRALDWLLEDPVLAAVRKDRNTVEIQREWWHSSGELPDGDASAEEADAWAYRHAALAAVLGYGGQSVHVDTLGYLGGPSFQFSLVVDGQPIDARSESALARGRLLLPCVYKAQRLLAAATRPPWPKSVQIATLAAIREQLSGAARLLASGPTPLQVTYQPHIADVVIRSVKSVSLGWTPSTQTQGLYSLGVDAIGGEGERVALNLGNLDSDAPLISESAKQHILLSPDLAVVARVAKTKGIVPRNRIVTDPLELLPEGHTYEGLELGDYSSRVLGFAPIERPEAEGRTASQVEWYGRDDDVGRASPSRVELNLALPNGEIMRVEVGEADLEQLREDACAALAVGGDIHIGGRTLSASSSLVAELERAWSQAAAREPEAPPPKIEVSQEPEDNPPASLARREAAVIDEKSKLEPARIAVETSDVPWAALQSILAPGIQLQEHQRHGVAWLWSHYVSGRRGALLADEMGLGKTLQICCFLALQAAAGSESDRARPSLIASPKILLENWQHEIGRYFRANAVPKVRVLTSQALSQLRKAGSIDLLARSPGWVILSYDALALYQKELLRIEWASAVLDESQNIKNPYTYRTAAARGLKRSFGICSTGTPIENRLRDLWTQFDFLSQLFEGPKAFCDEYEKTELSHAIQRLRRVLEFPSQRSPLLRRVKSECLDGLPNCTVDTHYIPMTRNQVEQERRVVHARGKALAILGDLQKLYQHPSLIESHELDEETAINESPKLRRCIELLRQVRSRDEKVLIFALYVRMQELLRRVIMREFGLFKVNVINGESNQTQKSQTSLDDFSSRPGFGVLILSPLAAGSGLNITAANHVIHYGRWWNPAREDQATARAHRLGQTRHVHVHHLVLHHPDDPNRGFDVKLHDFVERKRAMAFDFLAPADDPAFDEALRDLIRQESA